MKDINNRQKEINAFVREFFGPEKASPIGGAPNGTARANGKANGKPPGSVGASTLTDAAVLEKLFAERERGEKFRTVYNGNWEGHHPSPSEAVGSILHKLAFYTGNDPAQMERLIRGSGLASAKFDERRGASTWLGNDIAAAIEATLEPYQPKGSEKAKLLHNHKPLLEGSDGPNTNPTVPTNPLLEGIYDLGTAIEHGIDPPEELEPGILLKGRVHHLFAPAGVGKTFLALWLVARCLKRGQRVLYIDLENGPRIISERLELLGVESDMVRQNLSYLPFPTLDLRPETLRNYGALIEEIEPDLVIFDSWIKLLSTAGLEENNNDHIARWASLFLQPLREAQITSLVLDHVPHDGTRSRGASRKKDEVDVQHALIGVSGFDRATTGEIRLKLEKDREGWLPQSVTFSIGGSKDGGFVFSKSSGTTDGPGVIVIQTMERTALEALVENFGDSGARHNEWFKTCVPAKMSKTSFKRAREDLIRVHLVRRKVDPVGPKYYPTAGPGGSKEDGPDFSPFIREIPDRVQEGPNRVHGPDGSQEGPQGPPPFRGVDPWTRPMNPGPRMEHRLGKRRSPRHPRMNASRRPC